MNWFNSSNVQPFKPLIPPQCRGDYEVGTSEIFSSLRSKPRSETSSGSRSYLFACCLLLFDSAFLISAHSFGAV
jgi:hypothetical protein